MYFLCAEYQEIPLNSLREMSIFPPVKCRTGNLIFACGRGAKIKFNLLGRKVLLPTMCMPSFVA